MAALFLLIVNVLALNTNVGEQVSGFLAFRGGKFVFSDRLLIS